ncbi:hypothetical protein LAD12857_03950 [Lacrimispora amygdalina]|uniref:VOC domain-containing protein n=1 Tax=Lacrimispora amygdalina TaxID=253257 RepID=A0ABQ5M0L1_9FIRM|nr:VOC family protein [Eubacteriales bacterium]
MKYSWITLHVSDMERSITFYRDLLGLAVDREFGNKKQKIVFLGEGDDAKIELICMIGEKIVDAGKGVSIGFRVSGLDDMIDKFQKTVSVSIKGPFSPNQSIKFYMVSDPDGYQIQLYENL